MAEDTPDHAYVPAIMPPPEGRRTEAGSSGDANPVPQPRQPSNLQGLLRFVTEAARDDHSYNENYRPMPLDEERRKFLEDAINSLTIDVTAEMTKNIEILSNPTIISKILCDTPIPEEVTSAFDFLMDAIYNIDTSIGFYKLNGYSIFPVCFGCENSKIRELSCQILAELCQNNPFCQSAALECGFLQTMLSMLKTETEEKVLHSSLYATSCMVREHAPCTEEFLKEGGYSALARCVKMPFNRIRDKASFLISALYPRFPDAKRNEITEVVENMALALKSAAVDNHPRQVINGLRAILSSADTDVIAECSHPDLNLKESCETYLRFVREDRDCNREEIFQCEKVLSIINESPTSKLRKTSQGGLDVDR